VIRKISGLTPDFAMLNPNLLAAGHGCIFVLLETFRKTSETFRKTSVNPVTAV